MKILLGFIIIWSFSAYSKVEAVDDKIIISSDKNFESKFEIKSFEKDGKEAFLKETGYIIANTQTSFENEKFISKWISLDENTLKLNNINLSEVPPLKGLAYGIVTTSHDFKDDLKVGQKVIVKRYGLDSDHFPGTIHRIVYKENQDLLQIHFLASHSEELIAGTTCIVEVTHIKVRPFKVSLLSLLHLGVEDYIIIKERPGVYIPKHATLIDQDEKTATIIVPAKADSQYIARGAILLKPLLNKILKKDGHD